MAFPSVISSFTNPNAGDKLNSPSHSSIETAQNTELIQIEKVIGTDSSTLGTLIGDVRSAASSGGGHIQSANKGGTGQTAYTKGDLLVATSASVLAKLAIGTDGQILNVDSSQSSGIKWTANTAVPVAKTIIPFPVFPLDLNGTDPTTGLRVIDTNISSMLVGQIRIPFNIVANKLITANVAGGTGNYTMDVTLYTEDGSASIFSVTTSQLGTGARSVVTAIPGASITAGIYYIGTNGNTTGGSVQTLLWEADAAQNIEAYFNKPIAGKPVINGVYPSPAGVPPNSIVTSNIDGVTGAKVLAFRLDN